MNVPPVHARYTSLSDLFPPLSSLTRLFVFAGRNSTDSGSDCVFFSGAADGSMDRHGHCESFSQRCWKLQVETHAGTVPLAQRLRKNAGRDPAISGGHVAQGIYSIP